VALEWRLPRVVFGLGRPWTTCWRRWMCCWKRPWRGRNRALPCVSLPCGGLPGLAEASH